MLSFNGSVFITSLPSKGQILVISGCMFSGKSTALISQVERYTFSLNKEEILVFNHFLDKRYSECEIATHSGFKLRALSVRSSEEIRALVTPESKVIVVDEIQFFDSSLYQLLIDMANEGKVILCAGLDTNYKGEPFMLTAKLMAAAEYNIKLSAVCASCGHNARYSFKTIQDSDSEIQVGSTGLYKPLCRSCFVRESESLVKV